jgi:hypothetical protein
VETILQDHLVLGHPQVHPVQAIKGVRPQLAVQAQEPLEFQAYPTLGVQIMEILPDLLAQEALLVLIQDREEVLHPL